MKRVEFRLSMPCVTSWNGRWSGEGKNYSIIRRFTDKKAESLMQSPRWSYRFSDGWVACIEARIVRPGERLKPSDGFCGYDWMVDNILRYGQIKEPETAGAT